MRSKRLEALSVLARLALVGACSAPISTPAPNALAADVPPATSEPELVRVLAIEVHGTVRTHRHTIVELLPRPLPGPFTRKELDEFERRVANLELFDEVNVEERGARDTGDGPTILRVTVREKFSISPIVALSTGKTLADTSATLGAIENNIDGRATRLGGYAKYSERGPQFSVWLTEHSYHPRRWQKEVVASFTGSGYRFENSPTTWERTRLGGEIELKTPYHYGRALRYEFVTAFYRERLVRTHGLGIPEDGYFFGTAAELFWDLYRWNDTTPRGIRIALELKPGVFIGPGQPRHMAELAVLGAVPLGPRTVLAYRGVLEGVNAGNANHGLLLGSQRGVRGLPDSLYRNHAHAFANAELRHAFELAKRWYLQAAAFFDAAAFLPLDASGRATAWRGAYSTGAGLRLIPTALVKTIIRVDGARLVEPTGEWFVQFGLDQYF